VPAASRLLRRAATATCPHLLLCRRRPSPSSPLPYLLHRRRASPASFAATERLLPQRPPVPWILLRHQPSPTSAQTCPLPSLSPPPQFFA
jgi:hypothetical protein